MKKEEDKAGGKGEPDDAKDDFEEGGAADVDERSDWAEVERARSHAGNLEIGSSAEEGFAHGSDKFGRVRRGGEELVLPFTGHIDEKQREAPARGKHLIRAGGGFAEDFAKPIGDQVIHFLDGEFGGGAMRLKGSALFGAVEDGESELGEHDLVAQTKSAKVALHFFVSGIPFLERTSGQISRRGAMLQGRLQGGFQQ